MDEDKSENLDSQNEAQAEETTQEEKTEFSSLEKQQYERIKALEKELAEKQEPKQEETLPEEPKSKLDTDAKVDLRMDGYSKEEISYIERNMGDRTLEETLNDPFVKSAIESRRAESQADANTPAPSTTVPTFTADKKTWDQMSAEERKANWADVVSRTSNGRGAE